ncbi:hypothetical protein EMIT0324P_21080 [Pseudomonas chlororaphis]
MLEPAGAGALDRQFDQVAFDPAGLDGQIPQADRQLEAPRPGAARVDVEHLVLPEQPRLMGVAADHHPHARRQGLRHFGQDMAEQQLEAVELHGEVMGQGAGPGMGLVDIAEHRGHRRQVSEGGEYLRVADIAGMQDMRAALQRRQRAGAEQTVGVGDQAYFHRLLFIEGFLTGFCRGASIACRA